MCYALFLDDERFPKTTKEFIIARTFDQAVAIVEEKGVPNYISFDHDLGYIPDTTDIAKTGYDFAKWLVDYDIMYNKIPTDFSYNVHSANPVGAKNISGYLDGYLSYKQRS